MGLFVAAHFHAGKTLLFVVVGLAAVGAAAICIPMRLRFAATATMTALFFVLVDVNLAFCAHGTKCARLDVALMQGTIYGSFIPVFTHLRRRLWRARTPLPQPT